MALVETVWGQSTQRSQRTSRETEAGRQEEPFWVPGLALFLVSESIMCACVYASELVQGAELGAPYKSKDGEQRHLSPEVVLIFPSLCTPYAKSSSLAFPQAIPRKGNSTQKGPVRAP